MLRNYLTKLVNKTRYKYFLSSDKQYLDIPSYGTSKINRIPITEKITNHDSINCSCNPKRDPNDYDVIIHNFSHNSKKDSDVFHLDEMTSEKIIDIFNKNNAVYKNSGRVQECNDIVPIKKQRTFTWQVKSYLQRHLSLRLLR